MNCYNKSSYESRIRILKEIERTITDYFQNIQENTPMTIHANVCRTHARTRAMENQKEKLNWRRIRNTLLYRSGCEIPFGIDKTDGSHAQRTPKSKWDLRPTHTPAP